MKAAVFSHNGLGDLILSLQISHNFSINGWRVDTFHNGGQMLQNWFLHLPVLPYPQKKSVIPKILEEYEKIVIFHNDTDDFVLQLIQAAKEKKPTDTYVIYACPTKNIENQPYYKDSLFNYRWSMAKNMEHFCRNILQFEKVEKHNGFLIPQGKDISKTQNQVALHVTSSREGKNWPIQKYVKLALHLKKRGFEPHFIVGGLKEYAKWSWLQKKGFSIPKFESIDQIATFIAGCSYLIGNDSGLGHLASCLNVPTVTISRRSTVANFWRPDWTNSRIVTPSSWILNIRMYRFRDRNWKKLISVSKVLRSFMELHKERSK